LDNRKEDRKSHISGNHRERYEYVLNEDGTRNREIVKESQRRNKRRNRMIIESKKTGNLTHL